MKKQTLFLAVLFVASALAFLGCNKKEDVSSSDSITVYGFVSDGATGESLANVKVSCYDGNPTELEPWDPNYDPNKVVKMITSTVTGSDGTYEFTLSQPDTKKQYVVMTEKNGYMNYGDNLSLSNMNSEGKVKFDIQLYKE